MKPMKIGLSAGLAVSLLISACGPSTLTNSPISPRDTAPRAKQTQARQNTKREQFPTVRFQVDLPHINQGFRTQGTAQANFARLEVFNKENLASYNGANNLNEGDPGFLSPTQPILATNADAEGYVGVSGDTILLGAEVPTGPNWSVKIKLYSNKSDAGLIQELSAGFNLPLQNDEAVPVNAQTHLAGWVLSTLLAENPTHPGGGKLLSTPIDYTALQKFMDGFAGIPEDFEFGQTDFPATEESNNNPSLKTAISTKPVSYPNLEALSPQPEPVNGVPQAKPPAVTLAHLNKFEVADLVKNRLINNQVLDYASGAAAWNPDTYRIPGYLAENIKLQQRDSQGGTYALNGNRMFMVNNAVVNDPTDVIHGIDLNNGEMNIAFARNDLEQIDSRALSLGRSGDTGDNPVVYMMTRVVPAQGQENLKREAKLVAVNQNDGSTAWSFSDWNGDFQNCTCSNESPTLDTDSEEVDFTPVVQARNNQADVVYTVLHSNKAANDVAPTARGIHKIEAGDTPVGLNFYKHNKNSKFTRSGALSPDGSKLYMLTKASLGAPAELLVLNTSDLTLAQATAFDAADVIEQTSTPTVGRDGSVYVSAFQSAGNTSKGVVFKFDASGNQVWRYELPTINDDTKGQLLFAPTLHDPVGDAPELLLQTVGGRVYVLTDNGNNATEKWATDLPGNRPLFESPMLVQNQDDSLEIYTGTDTNTGRIYGLNLETGELKWQIFPAGFYSSGMIAQDNHAYLSTRSGNYGDFTYLRSIRTEAKRLAPASVSSWPKPGGDLANSGNPQKVAP